MANESKGNKRVDRIIEQVEIEDARVGHVHRTIHTVVKFQRVLRVFKINEWTMMEVQNEDGSKEIIGEHQILLEVDIVCGI